MSDELKQGVKRLFEILDSTETNEDGTREFHPTYITTCRAMVNIELNTLLPRLKELANS